jgi:hypothetical protein
MMGLERQARRCFHPQLPLTHHAVSLASRITLARVGSADYRRARLSALPGGGAFGCGSGPSSPPRASPAPRAADQGAGRAEICRLRWRAGLPLLPRQARRRGGQLSARPGYYRLIFVQQGEGRRVLERAGSVGTGSRSGTRPMSTYGGVRWRFWRKVSLKNG